MLSTKSPNVKTRLRRRKQLEQDIEHVTQEMYRRNVELAETNRTLALLRKIDEHVLDSHESVDDLGNAIAAEIVTATDFPFVAILARNQHTGNELKTFGVAANQPLSRELRTSLSSLRLGASSPWFESQERGLVINAETLSTAKATAYLRCDAAVVRQLQKLIPVKSLSVIKLSARRKLVGVMVIGLPYGVEAIPAKDNALQERLSEALGVALDNKLLLEENRRVLKALQKSNEKLKALDQSKDEFISMASHQLRTPLTSVKGYVSMVLDGDAGTINPMQRKLLEQAFESSQRMAYLIADLLNVSRLKTGKFIIDAKPIDLSVVVAGEISQLVGTAKAHNIELAYDKPKSLPQLMLDETKIRQVIMNFVDNAIYYTPAGGKITVSLADKPGSIEFTVTDNGIGVPKSEQPHLFTKFYRAGNAKKTRPDGTGLGLFMAKKVIVAQGGALMFKSQEGKGSTFGFIFSKDKLQPPVRQ